MQPIETPAVEPASRMKVHEEWNVTEQTESRESLGSYLRRQRELKQTSIEQIAYATRIGLKMLRALEDDDHASLPAPTFVRGYLQAYAKYLKLDTHQILTRYEDHLAASPDSSSRVAIKSHYLYVKERYQEKHRLVLVTLLSLAVLTAAGTYFILKSKKDHGRHGIHLSDVAKNGKTEKNPADTVPTLSAPVSPRADSPKAEEKSEAAPAAETKEKAAPPAAEPPHTVAINDSSMAKLEKPLPTTAAPDTLTSVSASSGVNPGMAVAPGTKESKHELKTKFSLLLKADTKVWLRYQTDEDEIKEITLGEGKAMLLKANRVFKIFSGNLHALHGKLNGKDIQALTTPDRSLSAVLPEQEIPNYPLPLFPTFQKKQEVAAPQNKVPPGNEDQTSSDN